MQRTTEGLPWEWRVFPSWVREELVNDAGHLSYYNWHLQKLAEHNDLMGEVWVSLESASHRFGRKGRVGALLEVLHLAVLGLDPGLPRTDDDRQQIADGLAKHLQEVLRQLERLGTGADPGRYPLPIAGALYIAAAEWVDKPVAGHFDSTRRRVSARLEAAGVDADSKAKILSDLAALQWDMESELTELCMDPKPRLLALARATGEWAENCRWERNEVIQHIAQELQGWLGGSQHGSTATLATIVCGDEVSEDAVAGVMKRAARKAQQSRKSRSLSGKLRTERPFLGGPASVAWSPKRSQGVQSDRQTPSATEESHGVNVYQHAADCRGLSPNGAVKVTDPQDG